MNAPLMIAASITRPRPRVTNPALSVGSVRCGLRTSRRAIRSAAPSSRCAIAAHLTAEVLEQPDALRGQRGPDLGRLGDPLDQLLRPRRSRAAGPRPCRRASAVERVDERPLDLWAGEQRFTARPRSPGASSTLISARSTAGLSSAWTIASSVASSTASSIPVAPATARAPRAPPPKHASLPATAGVWADPPSRPKSRPSVGWFPGGLGSRASGGTWTTHSAIAIIVAAAVGSQIVALRLQDARDRPAAGGRRAARPVRDRRVRPERAVRRPDRPDGRARRRRDPVRGLAAAAPRGARGRRRPGGRAAA